MSQGQVETGTSGLAAGTPRDNRYGTKGELIVGGDAAATAIPVTSTPATVGPGTAAAAARTVAANIALTDASIANASGSSEPVAAADTARQWLFISNPSATVSWWLNLSGGTAAANTAGSTELPPGASISGPIRSAVTGIATANTDLTVKTA